MQDSEWDTYPWVTVPLYVERLLLLRVISIHGGEDYACLDSLFRLWTTPAKVGDEGCPDAARTGVTFWNGRNALYGFSAKRGFMNMAMYSGSVTFLPLRPMLPLTSL